MAEDTLGQDFPMQRQCPFEPPKEYERLRAEQPISRVRMPDGTPAWLVTLHEDVRTVLASPAFSSDLAHPGMPAVNPEIRTIARQQRPPFSRMDPPEHSFFRRMLIPEFTVKRTKTLRAGIQSVVDGLIDDLLRKSPPVDLVDEFALPVPSLVICQLLGVPYSRHEFFQQQARVILSRQSTREQVGAAFTALRAYLDTLVEEKLHTPGDDLTSRLATEHLEPTGDVRRQDLVASCMLLLTAGHETTSHMISLGVTALLEHPDQLAALQNDLTLLPEAVEELVRYLSIADYVPSRVALEDVVIGGTVIRAGEGVVPLLAAADWDPKVFDNPGTLDIHRGNRRHACFGYGVHQCIGQHLARTELEVAFSTLFTRIPTLQIAAPSDELDYDHDGMLFGLHELPVTW
uniref:PauC n=1 Tax=Pseudonocardia autotrophica TaxID=2074 RepID=Q8KRU0_PSEAH|nr:PauC [Pseudonocardia autotrophica]